MTKVGLALIARIVLGGILLYAGALKVVDVDGFVQNVDGYQILDPLPVVLVAVTLPWVECGVGICLLLGLWTRGSALAATVLVVMFTAATASAAIRELNISCGCFSFDDQSVVTWRKVFEHGLLVVPAIFLLAIGHGGLALDGLWHRIRRPQASNPGSPSATSVEKSP